MAHTSSCRCILIICTWLSRGWFTHAFILTERFKAATWKSTSPSLRSAHFTKNNSAACCSKTVAEQSLNLPQANDFLSLPKIFSPLLNQTVFNLIVKWILSRQNRGLLFRYGPEWGSCSLETERMNSLHFLFLFWNVRHDCTSLHQGKEC